MDECVNSLGQKYGDRCRVIENQGDYAYIIRVRFGQEDEIQVQVSVPKDSNNENVDIFVRGGQDNVRARLETYLQHLPIKGSPSVTVVPDLFKSAEEWLSVNNNASACAQENETRNKKSAVKPKNKNGSKNTNSPENSPQKQTGMKTAEDVIKRLQWDKSLASDHFSVGYLDRFIGIVEKPFANFHNWGDIVNAEMSDLAIPQHRIQYFRYRTAKVWDKNEKVDLIFNSVGTGPTIYEVMTKEDEKSGCLPPQEVAEFQEDLEVDEEGEQVEESLSNEVEEQESGDVPKGIRPDYFLAIPIDATILKNRVSMVQESFKTQFSNVVKTLLDLDHLHLTVALFCSRDNVNGVADIVAALKNEKDSLKEIVMREIQFKGLNLLGDRVLCSCPSEEFKDAVLEPLKQIFNKYHIKYYVSSVPHLTIGKLNLKKDPENVAAIRSLVEVSRFNGCQSLNQFVLRRVGVKNTENEAVFDLN